MRESRQISRTSEIIRKNPNENHENTKEYETINRNLKNQRKSNRIRKKPRNLKKRKNVRNSKNKESEEREK